MSWGKDLFAFVGWVEKFEKGNNFQKIWNSSNRPYLCVPLLKEGGGDKSED